MKTEELTIEEKDFILTYGSLIHRLRQSDRVQDVDIIIRYYELINKHNALIAALNKKEV